MLRRKMNQFNTLHGEEPTEPPQDWNRQYPAAHLKYRTYPPKTNPLVSAIMGRLNHHAIGNGNVRFTLQSFQLNLTMHLFHIQTPLLSNQLMITKWTIYCNYSNHNMMIFFWMLTSRCFRLDWWLPLL